MPSSGESLPLQRGRACLLFYFPLQLLELLAFRQAVLHEQRPNVLYWIPCPPHPLNLIPADSIKVAGKKISSKAK